MAPARRKAAAGARGRKQSAFLKDFDREVRSRVEQLRTNGERLVKEMGKLYDVELLRLPVALRELNWLEFFAKGGSRKVPEEAVAVWRHMPASMDGAWVGTWRPHRPRGLISAQFPSPGPQYSIPGTTGYVGHSPTKARAPAYTFRGTKPPAAESCGPGPCYFVEPAITRNGKYVAPGAHLRGRPTTETTVTPGPSDYRTEAANRHVFKCPPVQSMAFRREPLRTDRPPGPGTYTLPRLMGPNTAYTSASPCYSVRGRSQRGRFDEDLAKTPGPAALPKVPVDAYKTRAPAYTMAARPKPREGKAAKPGPADYSVGRVTLIKPQAPASTFGIRHSLYTAPLIVE